MSFEREEQNWVEACARRIEAEGLAGIVIPLIDVARAYGFLGGQMLLFAQPFLGIASGNKMFDEVVEILESPQELDMLRSRLEGRER
jgi:hypothetical protein